MGKKDKKINKTVNIENKRKGLNLFGKTGMIALLLILAMCLLASCSQGEEAANEPIKVATLNGPTGIGMTYLMEDKEKYEITTYQSPDEIVSKIINGEVDIAAIPSNMAAVLYNKTKGNIVTIGANTLGNLAIVENGNSIKSMKDLKGKTIVAGGKGGVSEYVIQYLLEKSGLNQETDVKFTWLANHTDVNSMLLSKENTVAMLPEPFVTIAQNKGENVHKVIDLNEEWLNKTSLELPMGVLVAQKEFKDTRAKDLEAFIESYKKSVEKVNKNPGEAAASVVKYGFIGDEKIAEEAIPNCKIVMLTGEEGTAMLESFYSILFKINNKSLGGKMPDEGLYYEGK